MRWHRQEPGVYTAGPYKVERLPYHRALWDVSGPGVAEGSFEHKDAAQRYCGEVASSRAAEPLTVPVVGDVVLVREGSRQGYVGTIMTGNGEPLYCIKFVRGKRLCLFRREFEVIVP